MRVLTILCAVVLAAPAGAGIEDTILHGVSVGGVRAWSGPDAIPGLAKGQLQERAEAYLRKAGIAFRNDSPASLLVRATTLAGQSGTCFVYLDVRLTEEAKLERNGFLVEAASWKDSATVKSELPRCGEVVAEAEDGRLRDFVQHYKAMNPPLPAS